MQGAFIDYRRTRMRHPVSMTLHIHFHHTLQRENDLMMTVTVGFDTPVISFNLEPRGGFVHSSFRLGFHRGPNFTSCFQSALYLYQVRRAKAMPSQKIMQTVATPIINAVGGTGSDCAEG